MSEETYTIVFKGRIQEGFSIDAVKTSFENLFKIRPEKTEKMFSGRPIILRKNLSYDNAVKFERAIRKCGAECSLLKETPAPDPVAMKSEERTEESVQESPAVYPPKTTDSKPVLSAPPKKEISEILKSYRQKCISPHCFLVPEIPAELLAQLAGVWEHLDESEHMLAWFEADRHPKKAFGMLLTDKHLYVRSLTSGKRSIPISDIGKIKIIEKNNMWQLELGVSNLFRNIPSKKHETLDSFLSLCLEVAGLPPQVKKIIPPVPEKGNARTKVDSSDDTKIGLVVSVIVLVATGLSMELLMSYGVGFIAAFFFALILVLLTPTVIGLVIASWFVGLLTGVPAVGLALRVLFSTFIGFIIGLIVAIPFNLNRKTDAEGSKGKKS